jgi:hypothetical protein
MANRQFKTRKHVTLIKCLFNSVESYKLLDSAGVEIEPFNIFAHQMSSWKLNTRKSYCTAVADFYDYLVEAGLQRAAANEGRALSRSDLHFIIQSWPDFLVQGERSGNEFVATLSASLMSPELGRSSLGARQAGLALFLRLSEKFRADMQELHANGLSTARVLICIEN